MYIYIYICATGLLIYPVPGLYLAHTGSDRVVFLYHSRGYEQALVCLSNGEIVDASRGRTFHYKMANHCFITVFSLIVLA